MSKKVLILDASSISGRSTTFNSYSKEYILGPIGAHFEKLGAEPVVKVASDLKNVEAVREAVDGVDAVLIPGGEDVHPAFYDGAWSYKGGGLHTAKGDLHQMEAVRYAVLSGKRVFGICRGLQVMNVALGGTLIQDFGGHKNKGYKDMRDRFAVTTIRTEHELLSKFTDVRCSHHQGIKELGHGLVATAHAHDGVVEGVEHTSGLAMAVQFHPEAEQTFDEQMPYVAEWLLA